MKQIKLISGMVLFVFIQSGLQADERILSFHSDITVDVDGSMEVEETIQVRAEQDRIRRGIYRDFPTTYRDNYGNSYRVDFQVTGVLRDGTTEYYFTQSQSNGVRVYIGREYVLLSPGEYTYTFRYRTNRQLGFFDDHDELYWNVTGNGWEFPIDQASARIFLPEVIPSNQVTATAYTGAQGSTGQAFEEYRTRGGTVYIEATRPLASTEGLTIAVGWPKGFVVEPDLRERLGYFYQDNRHLLIGSAGILLLLGYYLLAWWRVGRDPAEGVVITRYNPPDGYSPASLRFIERMGFDETCFAAAIINLAVKGYLRITENNDVYTLAVTGNKVNMAPGEAALVHHLIGTSKTRVLKQSNHSWIKQALEAHEASLRRNYEFNYFMTNSGYFIFGIVFTLAILVAAILMTPNLEQAGGSIFIIIWLSIWSIAVYFMIKTAVQAWRRINGLFTIMAAVQISLFAAVFTGIEIFVYISFGQNLDHAFLALILVAAGVNWLFYELLKAPTLAGRKLLDKVAGFRNYIEIAEKQELAARHPGGRSPELFERYLPYALALGVEQQWAEKFTDVLTKVSVTGTAGYRPAWYSGSSWDNNHIGDFSSSLGSSFSHAIAASASPPGSSSGGSSGGGGGSSGGGGGGGGGGGW